MSGKKSLIPAEKIEKSIILIRNQKAILDKDLAVLYGVTTSNLNKAVNRNVDRFPEDFMLTLTKDEFENLKFHFGTSSWGGTRKLPRAFTEQGIAMLSSVLRSEKAILVNIEIMRAFVKIRQILSDNKTLSAKLEEMEKKYDKQFAIVFQTIRQMLSTKEKSIEPIGFKKG